MRTEIQKITPMIAKDYLRKHISNRPLRVNRVNSYASQMINKQWHMNGEGIKFDTTGMLIDGQHRLHAIIKAGIMVEMLVIYGIGNSCHTTIDTGLCRTVGDALHFTGAKNSAKIGNIIRRYIVVKNGISSINLSNSAKRLIDNTNINLIAIYEENPNFWQEVHLFADTCYRKNKLIKHADYGGYTAFLLINNRPEVKTFFERFAKMEYGSEHCPLRLLQRNLISNEITSVNKMTGMVKHAYIIKTWNNYIQNKENKILKYSPTTDPFPIIIF